MCLYARDRSQDESSGGSESEPKLFGRVTTLVCESKKSAGAHVANNTSVALISPVEFRTVDTYS
jgi:hypothetical protein